MSLRQVTVGVVGHGSVSDNLVCDALNQHFSFGPTDAEGYFAKSPDFDVHLIFPVGMDRFTPGIESVWQWAVRAEIPFLALSDKTEFPMEEPVRSSLLQLDDWQYAASPEAEIISILQKSVNPLLLVLTDSGEYTDELRQHAAAALVRGIPVYDLSRALLEQSWHEIGVDPDTVTQAQPDPELTLSSEDATAIAQTLAATFSLLQELRQVAGSITDLQPAIARAERALRLPTPAAVQEPSSAAAPVEATETRQDEPADTADKADTADPRRTRLEIYDEETDTWRPAGRGRPKQGVRTRRVPK